jgi:hypothetical protein
LGTGGLVNQSVLESGCGSLICSASGQSSETKKLSFTLRYSRQLSRDGPYTLNTDNVFSRANFTFFFCLIAQRQQITLNIGDSCSLHPPLLIPQENPNVLTLS